MMNGYEMGKIIQYLSFEMDMKDYQGMFTRKQFLQKQKTEKAIEK